MIWSIKVSGDTLSFIVVIGQEAVEEIVVRLKTKANYLSPSGGLTLPMTTDVNDLVLSFMTGDD